MIALFSMAFFVINISAFAANPETLQPSDNLYVTDTTNTLSQSTIDQIVERNTDWQQTKTQPEVAVVIVDDVGDYGDVDTFAEYLLRQPQWAIGNQDFDNGVLILFALNGGKNNMRISTGYGAEGVLPDIKTYQIMQDNLDLIKSKYKSSNDEGIRNVFDQVAFQVDQIAGDSSNIPSGQSNGGGIEDILLLIVVLVIWFYLIKFSINGGYNGVSTSGVWVGRSDHHSGGGSFGGGSFGGGSFGGGGSSV